MRLIVGLGNPGKEYQNTRHNVGFFVVERLAASWNIAMERNRFHGRFGNGRCRAEPVLLLMPQTYMNRSGLSVSEAMGFYKLPLDALLIIVDDMALDLGLLRLRPSGSAGGHNGLKDIIARLGDDGFARLRIGIGTAGVGRAVGHVLGPFSREEQEKIEPALNRAVEAVESWIHLGIDKTMTEYNRKEAE